MAVRPVIARVCDRDALEEGLGDYLERRGYDFRTAHQQWNAEQLLGQAPDLALVDLRLAEIDGLDLLRRFGARAGTLFIMVGDAPDVVDRVLALEMGAADVIGRPIVWRELVTRINGLLVRLGRIRHDLVILENSTVDLKAALVMHHSGEEEQLSPGQVALIRLFAASPRKVFGRDDLIAAAPADTFDAFDRSIDSRIVRLRRKLDTESIVTVRGSGYRFDPPAEPTEG